MLRPTKTHFFEYFTTSLKAEKKEKQMSKMKDVKVA